ncbi:MAG: multicopper oxidase family protein, partial [Alphaproteobacteria bacterium]
DDWLLKEDGSLHEESFGSLHDRAHAGRLGNVLTLNGAPHETIPVRAGERIRLRLCNSCNSRILELKLEDVAAHVIARDGQPVEPKPLEDGRLSLAPAQRIDLAVDMTGKPGSRSAIAEVSQGRVVAGIFAYHPSETRKRREELLRLPANQLSEPAADPARKVDLIMTGGAMGGMERALFKGRELPIRELARQHGMVWAFNGVAGMGEKPLFSVRKGESVEMRMVNDTRWPHAIHMHGHHFRQSDAAGGSSAAPWLDTILIARDETATVRFVADNPGKWMIHCHMLEHQAAGMGTWFEVTG